MPVLQVRHPKTGKIVEIKLEEGQAAPTPEQLGSLFEQPAQNISLVQDEGPSPSQRSISVPTEIDPTKPYSISPVPQQTAEEKISAAVTPVKEAVTQFGKTVLAGPIGMPGAIQRGFGKIAKGVRQMGGRPLSALAAEEMQRGNPEQMTREIGLPTGPLGVGMQGEAQPGAEEGTPGGLPAGLLNLLAGIGEAGIGVALGATPTGIALAGSTSALNQLPKGDRQYGVGDVTNFLTAPASTMKLAEGFGLTDPEMAANVNLLGDVAAQGGMLRAAHGPLGIAEAAKKFVAGQKGQFKAASLMDELKAKIKSGEMTREEATQVWRDAQQKMGEMAPMKVGGEDLLGAVMPNGEKIVQAAIKIGNKVFVGNSHADAYRKAAKVLNRNVQELYEMRQRIPDGFSTDKGTFVDRQQALDLAVRSGQLAERAEGRSASDAQRKQEFRQEYGLSSEELRGSQLSTAAPGLPVDKLNTFLQRAARGGEIPWTYDRKVGLWAGKKGEKHLGATGKPSGAFDVAGRFTADGTAVSIWNEPGQVPQQRLADALFELVQTGKVKRDAIVYWSDGTNMKIRDAIGGEGGLEVEWMPGVSKPTIDKAIRIARQLTLAQGGSTVDPRTGREVPLGANEGFVSIFPERTMVVNRATSKDLLEFAKKNGDLLKLQDHYIGTWKDPETKKVSLDVVVKQPIEEAKALGAEHFQKAIYGRAGEAQAGEVMTGGTGVAPEGWKHPVAEGERLSAFRESRLPPEERAALAEQRKARATQPTFAQEFGQQPNQIETAKRAAEYQSQRLGMEDLPVTEDVQANARRIAEVMGPDLEFALREWDKFSTETGVQRKQWYKGMDEARKILSKYYPELKNTTQGKLFSYAMNIFANGDSPNNEFMNGIAAWERRQKTGRFEPVKEGEHEFIGNVRVNTWNAHLEELQRLIDLKGEKGAIKWLETKHPVSELNTVKNQIKSNIPLLDEEGKPYKGPTTVASEYGIGQPQEGAFIFGPKMGAYVLNKEGISGPVTLDKWMNVAFRIARGIVNTEWKRDQLSGEMVEKLAGASTTLERRASYMAMNDLAKKFGITPEDAQALLWVHVIRPFFERHGQTMKGGAGSHGDFARWLDESGWLNRRVRGESASLIEGGEVTRQRGISEAATSVPASLRERGIPKGEAAEGAGGDISFDFGAGKMSIAPGLEGAGKKVKDYAASLNLNNVQVNDKTKEQLRAEGKKLKEDYFKEYGEVLTDEQVIDLAKKAAAWDTAVPADTKIEFNARMLRLRQELTQEASDIEAAGGQMTQRFLHLQRVYNSNARFLGTSLQKLHIMAKGARKSTDVEILANDILTRIEKTNANMDLVEQRAMAVNWNDNNQVAKFYREYVKPSMVELLDEYRYINMLSSPRTHLINAHSNLLQAAIMAPATKAVAYGPGEAAAYYRGAARAFAPAVKEATDVLMGRQAVRRMDLEHIPSMGVAPTGGVVKRTVGKVIAQYNRLGAPVTRALEASDILFRRVIEGGELEAIKRRDKKAGLKTDDVEALQQAADAAAYWIFRGALDPSNATGQGAVLSAIDKASSVAYKIREVPGGKYLLPFVATPMNIFKQGVEFSPAGFATMYKAKNKRVQFSKALIGSAVFGTTLAAMMGTESTWSEPRDEGERAQFREEGKIPFAIKIGDKWVSYSKLGPISYPMALAAAYKHFVEKGDDTAINNILNALGGSVQFFADQSYVQGLQDLTNFLSGKMKKLYGIGRNVGRQMVPLTAFATWLNQIADGTRRAPEGVFEDLTTSLPGLSQEQSPRYGILGKEQEKPLPAANMASPFAVSEASDNPVVKRLEQKGIRLGLPERKVFGQRLAEGQYQRYVQQSGQALNRQLLPFVNSAEFMSMSVGEAQKEVNRIKGEVYDETAERLFPTAFQVWMNERGD